MTSSTGTSALFHGAPLSRIVPRSYRDHEGHAWRRTRRRCRHEVAQVRAAVPARASSLVNPGRRSAAACPMYCGAVGNASWVWVSDLGRGLIGGPAAGLTRTEPVLTWGPRSGLHVLPVAAASARLTDPKIRHSPGHAKHQRGAPPPEASVSHKPSRPTAGNGGQLPRSSRRDGAAAAAPALGADPALARH